MKKKSAARPADAYARTPDCVTRITGLKLPPELWAVFALTDQPVTAEQISKKLGLDPEAALASLRSLTRRKLIQKHVLGWQDYLAVSHPVPVTTVEAVKVASPAAPSPVPAPAAVTPPPAPLPKPILSVTVTPPSTYRGEPDLIKLSFRNPEADARRQARTADLIRFTVRKTPAIAPSASAWKLRPILDSIVQKGGGGLTGQLLAYRVFLGIPAEITSAAGLSSLSLVNDDFTVTDPRLMEALATSARAVAGLSILPQAA